jgi:uncharacterized phage protein (TIGR02220 family)
MQGWLKLHRELIDKPIWIESTPEQKTIFITLLMMANHKENEWEWQGERYIVKPGQFITSLDSIVKKSGHGISIQNARTALKRFEKYGFLTNQSTNKNRLITIVNWGLYQDSNDELTSNLTANQQATNKQLTTNKNYKELKNDKEKTPFVEIITYLNEKTGKKFSPKSEANKKLINGRFAEGRTLEDFKHVINLKCQEWLNNPEMSKYLRPETLFAPKNFEKYVNEGLKPKQQQVDPRDKDIEFHKWIADGNDPDAFDWKK